MSPERLVILNMLTKILDVALCATMHITLSVAFSRTSGEHVTPSRSCWRNQLCERIAHTGMHRLQLICFRSPGHGASSRNGSTPVRIAGTGGMPLDARQRWYGAGPALSGVRFDGITAWHR